MNCAIYIYTYIYLISQHTSAHASAHVSTRQHTSVYLSAKVSCANVMRKPHGATRAAAFSWKVSTSGR